MKTPWFLALALAGALATPAAAQDDAAKLRRENAKLRAEVEALIAELNRVKDDLITKDRTIDRTRREYGQRLEAEQRKAQDRVRLERIEQAEQQSKLGAMEFEQARLRALLKQHGIELPAPLTLAERVEQLPVSVYFEEGYTLGDALAFVKRVSGVDFSFDEELGKLEVQPLVLNQVTVKNVLELVLGTLDEPLGWRVDGETVRIERKTNK